MIMRSANEKLPHIKVCMRCLVSCFLLLFISVTGHSGRASLSIAEAASQGIGIEEVMISKNNFNHTHSNSMRKLLLKTTDYEGGGMDDPCPKDSILIFQGQNAPLPSGIPTYSVQIQNVCITDCSIYNIHVSCGWFSSAQLVDPNLFRRLAYDDCLVNDGNPLNSGESLFFSYANTFSYPLSVSTVAC